MRLKLFILFFSIGILSFSQGEANNWFFGENAGLKFSNSGTPSAQSGTLNTLEGCASISDSNGNLLFYSDGTTVYTKTHQIMENGTDLKGHSSSTQSAIIVPNPLDENIYYLFTVGQFRDAGFHYYTIDLSKNNGEGAVVGDEVNLDPTDGTYTKTWTEKITAVKSNDCDYWVISVVENKILAYRVDENGVNTDPVSSSGSFFAYNTRGYLKVSPNGKKLAIAHQGIVQDDRKVILYDFNRDTGEATNENIIYQSQNDEQPYGLEFSAETKMLYMTTTDFVGSTTEDEDSDAPQNGTYRLYQFELDKPSISRTKTLIYTEKEAFRGALQLGPDKKIYATIPETYFKGTTFLDVIHEPEKKGSACRFRKGYIYLGGKFSMQGLPPFIQSIFAEDEINIVNPFEEVDLTSSELAICENSEYTLSGPDIPDGDYSWSFNNGSGEIPIPLPTPRHQLTISSNSPSNIGKYTLTIETNDKCNLILKGEANLSFINPPNTKPLATLIKCDLFDSNPSDGLTFFNLKESLDELTYNDSENFSVHYYLTDSDAKNDQFNQNALPNVFSSTIPNQTITAKLFYQNSKCYSLSKVELIANVSIVETTTDLIECEIENDEASFDLKTKKTEIINALNIGNNVAVYFYDSIENALNETNVLGDFKNSAGETIYFNITQNGICYGSGEFNLIVSTFPDLDLEENYILCKSDYPIKINAGVPIDIQHNYEYIWSTGALTHEIEVKSEADISLIIRAKLNACEFIKTFEIQNAPIPSIVDYEVVSNTSGNTIHIITDTDFENLYAIGSPLNPYKSINSFENLVPGVYDVFVKNKYECSTVSKKIYVLGFPKFFTPNDDGYNDHWQLIGLDQINFSFSDIQIFDRFGKHLKSIAPNGHWSGIYNDIELPSSDYWFSFNVTDKENITKNYKGHFSLIRR